MSSLIRERVLAHSVVFISLVPTSAFSPGIPIKGMLELLYLSSVILTLQVIVSVCFYFMLKSERILQ